VKEIEEENLLDKELLYAIFHDLRLQETSVHHFILLDSLKKIVANNIWDAHSSVIGPVMFNTVSGLCNTECSVVHLLISCKLFF